MVYKQVNTPTPRSVGRFIGFSKPYYGGSYCRIPREARYRRRFESLLHYPLWNNKHQSPLDWRNAKKMNGYEAISKFGSHTIELKGIPFGVTNQTIEERMRRYFSQFGPVTSVHSVPHPRDSFQSSGTGYVTFRSKICALRAMKGRLKFPSFLRGSVVTQKNLENDTRGDPLWQFKEAHACSQLPLIARGLYEYLDSISRGISIAKISKIIMETKFGGDALQASGPSVFMVYQSWFKFLDSSPMRRLFLLSFINNNSYPNRQPLTPPTGRCRRVVEILTEMFERDEWPEWFRSHPKNFMVDSQPVESSLIDDGVSPIFSALSTYKKKDEPLPSKLSDVFQRQSKGHNETDMAFSHLEQSTMKAYLNDPSAKVAHEPSLLPFTHTEREFVRNLIKGIRARGILITRRILPPDEREVAYRLVHANAKETAEKNRAPFWRLGQPKLPQNVKNNMHEFFFQRKLPERLQLQSRAEKFYGRIYDERHMFWLQLQRQQKSKSDSKKDSRDKRRERNKQISTIRSHQIKILLGIRQ